MKIEQIRYVLAVYETGSISKAAQKFFMSRPNMSNAIRNLENEIGFEILERGVDGVRFTKKGQQLIGKCMNILKEVDEIRGLADDDRQMQFGVINPNSPQVEDAFVKLCRMAADSETGVGRYRLSMYREYQYEGMKMLNQKKADLAVTVSPNLQAPSMLQEMAERGLEYVNLWEVPVTVSMAKDHPLAKDPDFQFEKLRDYPFVSYVFEKDRGSPYNQIGKLGFVNLSKLIRVDSGFMKSKLISETWAYGIGIDMPEDWSEEHNRHCIPIPGLTMEMGYIRRAGEPVSEPERLFLEFLKEEMGFLGEGKQ